MMGCLNQAFWTWFNHVTHLTDRREKKNMEDFFPRQELTNNLVLGALARKNFAAPTRLKHLLFSVRRHCLKSKVAFNCIYLNSNFFSYFHLTTEAAQANFTTCLKTNVLRPQVLFVTKSRNFVKTCLTISEKIFVCPLKPTKKKTEDRSTVVFLLNIILRWNVFLNLIQPKKLVLGALARQIFAAPTRPKHVCLPLDNICLKSKVAQNFFFLEFETLFFD